LRQDGWRLGVKRGFDIVGAASGLLLLSPVTALTAVAVRLSMGAPIFFRQQRPGRDARPFVLLKFRTMRDAQGANGKPLPDEARATRTGRVLRSLSLDELPQLWNVLRGDMSLVGPRPLLMQYLARYNVHQARRHEVLPGITGWAQVNGRNHLSHEERFELDLWYVDNWSPRLDAKILWLTLRTVLRRSGVSSPNHITMPEFMGTLAGTREYIPTDGPSSAC
jgi:lipopolysaccharide/colanic/teichoic acid biosynthesis glycosyltransferase